MFVFEKMAYQEILKIQDMEIPHVQMACIVGESGSGKTTLLRLLNKMISPTQGEIYFQGQPLSQIDSVSHRREVTMLPQNPVIFPGSIRHNLLLGTVYAQKQPPSEQDISSVLKLVRLNKDLEGSAGKLSGGEKQRLALARLMLMNPRVFLLDEPSSALDDETEQLVIDCLKEFTGKNGQMVVMITHSRQMAERHGDFIAEIKSGKVASTEDRRG